MRVRLPFTASGRSVLFLALPVLTLAAVATGCGGSARTASGPTTSTTAPRGAGGTAAARARFTSCLEAHGVPASEATQGFGFRRGAPGSSGSPASSSSSAPPATSTPPTTSAAFAAAFQACRSDLPARPAGGLPNSAAGRAYLQCLQLHGVTIPTTSPTTGTGGTAGTAPANAFRSLASNPAYQAARSACAARAPNRPGSGSGSGSGTTSTTSAA